MDERVGRLHKKLLAWFAHRKFALLLTVSLPKVVSFVANVDKSNSREIRLGNSELCFEENIQTMLFS